MLDLSSCQPLDVPAEMMQHVVKVESAFNPYAIGVVGGHLRRQPRSLREAVATARQLQSDGRNFSVGLAQVNLHNFARLGLATLEQAFQVCPNVQAGARVLAQCHRRYGDWGRALSCYYSGNAITGFRHGYVQKVVASLGSAAPIGMALHGAGAAGRAHPQRREVPVRGALVRRRLRPDAGQPPAGGDAAFVF